MPGWGHLRRGSPWFGGWPMGFLMVCWLAAACAPSGGPAAAAPGTAGVGARQDAVPATAPAGPPLRLIANYSARGSGQSGIWLAYEGGYFREQGLDAELTNVSATPRILPAMLAGEVHISGMDPGASILASLEGIDMTLLFAGNNKPAFSIVTQSNILQPQDLRGKSLGISRLGASTHTSALLALDMWGLVPDRDVAFRQLGDSPALMAGLESGQVDAAMLSVPWTTMAKRSGFHELLNLGTAGPEYPTVIVGALRSWVAANEETVRRAARAYAQGRQRLLNDKPWAMEVFRQYLQLDDPAALDEFYVWVSNCCPRIPYISEEGTARLIADLAREEPRLVGRQPSEWIDSRFLREAEAAGIGGTASGVAGR